MKISLCSIRFREEPIEEVVERTAQLGYDGTEIVIDHVEDYLKRKGELASLRDFVHSKGLEIPIIAPAFNFTGTKEELEESMAKAYRCIDYAKALGAPLIRAFVSKVGSAEATELQWEQCVSALKELATAAHAKKIAFAIETHPNQLMDTVQTTLELINRVNSPGLRVLLDIWHLFNEGKADPVEALHALYPYMVHIHAKNMIRRPEGNKIVYFEEGDMDYPAFLEALKKTNYDRFISVEWFGEQPWTAAEHELAYLKRFLEKYRATRSNTR